MNIFFAINEGYYKYLRTTLISILENNKETSFDFYVLHSQLSNDAKKYLDKLSIVYNKCKIHYVEISDSSFDKLKLNISHISKETYFRYIIADLFPEMDRALYLDADLVVNGDIKAFYNTDIADYYCAGVRDLYVESLNHKEKIGLESSNVYINAGVLLLNLDKIRQDDVVSKLFANTSSMEDIIEFQDQDIINFTFKDKIKEVESIFNFTYEYVKKEKKNHLKATIIHYTGKKKPWHKESRNKLNKIWQKYEKINQKIDSKKIKIGLLIDEFFGGAGTTFGGYGFLARKYIAKYIPDENFEIEVLLGKGKKFINSTDFEEDGIKLYRLPRKPFFAKRWLKKQNYDIYLSIELTTDRVLMYETDPSKKLILWIQDPRPKYEWDEIETMTLMPEPNYYNQRIYDLVHDFYKAGRVKFISQGYFLNQKAKDLYRLEDNVDIQYVPNPIDINENFDVATYKKQNKIIFLGRIEDVKRGWLFCEIAKKMPEYEFHVLGKTNATKEQTKNMLDEYKTIPNLHFAGHVDGEEKEQYLKDAKILVNTSIHEALPISFLEALSYGTLLVSNRNPEDLTNKFGIWTGDVIGNGFDKVDLYVDAIKQLITDESRRQDLAIQARKYVEEVHSTKKFITDLKDIIVKEVNNG